MKVNIITTIVYVLFGAALFGCSSPNINEKPLVLWYDKPASTWNEALPIGNGRIGAMVKGNTDYEEITLNEETLWSGYPKDGNNEEALAYLPLVREAVLDENYLRADSLSLNMQGGNSQPYAPMGILQLQYLTGETIKKYKRSLDLRDAIAHVEYTTEKGKFIRELFVSAPDQVMVMNLKADSASQLSFNVGLKSLLKFKVELDADNQIILKGKCPKIADPVAFPDNPVQYDSFEGEGMNFDLRLKLLTKGGDVKIKDSLLIVENSDEATILISAGTSYNGFDKSPGLEGKDPEVLSKKYLKNAEGKKYETLKKRHLYDYKTYFSRVELDLNADYPSNTPTNKLLKNYKTSNAKLYLQELLFQYGRYLIISGSRPGGIPLNLQGIWSHKVLPPWNDNYTNNINLEMNYWATNTTNLTELNEPLVSFMQNLSKNGAHTAKSTLDCDGWCAYHNSDIWAMTNTAGHYGKYGMISIQWMHFPLCGAWLSSQIYDQFKFTNDIEYLRDKAYPLMKGAAIFALDWLVEGPNNELMTCPSTSPENMFITENNVNAAVSFSSTCDMAIIKGLFKECIESAELLNVDHVFVSDLKEALKKLPEYKIGKYGQLQEWYYDWDRPEDKHRHVSHLYGLHPGNQISPVHTPDLAKACEKSLIMRGDGGTGWSLAWKINLWARLLNGNKAYALVENVFHYVDPNNYNLGNVGGGCYPNLLGACPPYMIDGNLGYVAGIAEMLLQSHLEEVHVLPALPDAWASGNITGLRARGGYDIDLEWENGELTKLAIIADQSGVCKLRYKGYVKEIELKSGEEYIFDKELNKKQYD